MNIDDYYTKLGKLWKKLNLLRKEDKNKSVEILAFDNFWYTINKKDLPGIRIKLKNTQKVSENIFPKAKGWEIVFGSNVIEMYLNNKNHEDFFIKIVNLIIAKIYLNKLSGLKSIQLFFEELNSGKNFFEDEDLPRKLTKESEIGLYGEVYVLSKILTKKLTNENAISSWTGPSKKHDFTTENKLIEVKTTVTNTKKINTSSTNQIAPVFDKRLDLVFLQMKKSSSGISLNGIIDEYINKLKIESANLHNDFLLKLTQCRYLDMHKDEYMEKYSVDKTNYYKISDDFPYIKKVEVPLEISDLSITYKIDLEKCESFRIMEDEFLKNI